MEISPNREAGGGTDPALVLGFKMYLRTRLSGARLACQGTI